MKRTLFCSLAFCYALVVSSCKKDHPPAPEPARTTLGVYVVSVGDPSKYNAALTFYDFATKTATTDIYANVNNDNLGTAGSDVIIYGSKMYVVLNLSSCVKVLDAVSVKSIAKVDLKTKEGFIRLPRYAVPYKNKILVSCTDGTIAVIDTTSLTLEKNLIVGGAPEQMVVTGDKLYVTNTGEANQLPDSSVSVIDLKSFSEIRKIKVGLNPHSITADNSGNVYVACSGNYFQNNASLFKIDGVSDAVVKSADTSVGRIVFYNGLLYANGTYQGSHNLRTLSTTDFKQTSANFITDGTALIQPYGLNIDQENGDVYVTDAINYTEPGIVYCFDKTGHKKFSFSSAPANSPIQIAILRK